MALHGSIACSRVKPQTAAKGLNLNDREVQQIQQQLVGLQARHKANPADPKVTLELATIYLRLKQNEQALKLLDSLVKQPGLEISTRFTVASVYQNLGQGVKAEQQKGIAREALKQLEAKLAAEPGNFDLALDLATTHVQLGQAQRGVDVLAHAIRAADDQHDQPVDGLPVFQPSRQPETTGVSSRGAHPQDAVQPGRLVRLGGGAGRPAGSDGRLVGHLGQGTRARQTAPGNQRVGG